MKNHKDVKTPDDLFTIAENNGGYLLLEDNYGKFWVIEQLKRVSSNVTVSQTCIHEWVKEDYDDACNAYLARHCPLCHIRQRFITATGEWNTVGYVDGKKPCKITPRKIEND